MDKSNKTHSWLPVGNPQPRWEEEPCQQWPELDAHHQLGETCVSGRMRAPATQGLALPAVSARLGREGQSLQQAMAARTHGAKR